jgi:hypothetical protein
MRGLTPLSLMHSLHGYWCPSFVRRDKREISVTLPLSAGYFLQIMGRLREA